MVTVTVTVFRCYRVSSLQSLDGFFEIIINYTILMAWPTWSLPPTFYNKSVVISWKVHNLRPN